MSRNSMYHCGRSPGHTCEPLERRRLLAGIALDLNYGADGRAIVELGMGSSSVESVLAAALQPGGRVLMVGATAASEMALVRLTAEGTRDASFGIDGAVRYREGTAAAQANDVIVLPDGRLLVAGYAGSPVQPRLLRFFANGRL